MSKHNKKRNKKANNKIVKVPESKRLLEEYGIEFEVINDDPQALIASGYTKLPKEAYSKMSAVFQYMPGLAANNTTYSNASVNSKMMEGAYKVIIKDGMHLAKSKATDGAFRGTLLSDATKQVSGQAELLKIDPIELSKTPQYALGVFSALSMATGQYFLTEINNRLNSLESQVGDVQAFLADDKRSKLFACEQILNEIFQNMQAIKNNESEKQATLVEIKTIKREAIGDMQFFNSRLAKDRSSLSVNDKKEIIVETVNKIGETLPQYWCSLSVYSKACLLEIMLSDNDDPEFLAHTQDNLLKYRDQYNNEYHTCRIALRDLLNEAKSLNWSGTIPLALTAAAAVLVPNKTMKTVIAAAGTVATGTAEHNKAKAKEAIENDVNGILKICGDLDPIDAVCRGVDQYRIIRNNPIEFIQTSDAAYIKYHKDDEESYN